jgi:hypothetical protein
MSTTPRAKERKMATAAAATPAMTHAELVAAINPNPDRLAGLLHDAEREYNEDLKRLDEQAGWIHRKDATAAGKHRPVRAKPTPQPCRSTRSAPSRAKGLRARSSLCHRVCQARSGPAPNRSTRRRVAMSSRSPATTPPRWFETYLALEHEEARERCGIVCFVRLTGPVASPRAVRSRLAGSL